MERQNTQFKISFLDFINTKQIFVVFPASGVGVKSLVKVNRCCRSLFTVGSRVRAELSFCVKQKSWENNKNKTSTAREVLSWK